MGIGTTAGGCRLKIDESIQIDSLKQTYVFLVKITEIGICRPLHHIYFLLLIPKQSDEKYI